MTNSCKSLMNIVADSGIGVQRSKTTYLKKSLFFEICPIQLANLNMKIMEI